MKNSKKTKLPIGVSNFKDIIEKNYYYFDKTKFIENILEDGSQVKLFTRPRRFGKTLNMSMLKYFFDVKNKDENRKLFEGLNISKSEYFGMQGNFPVISVSFKKYQEKDWKNGFDMIKDIISGLYDEFEFVKEKLSTRKKKKFDSILMEEANLANWKNSLADLSNYLYDFYGKKVIVLIDEYDQPIINSYIERYYDETIDFFKSLYGAVLKDNEYLEMGVMTGIIRVIKAGIFSDLNNLNVYSILENEYSEFFGFNQDEVEETLEYFDVKYELFDVKAWYDGYKFGDSDVYNPWSILKFLKSKKIGSHWIDTSGNFLINQILKNTDSEIMETLEALFNGETVEENISGNSDLSSLLGQEEIWELLLFSGYLTIDEKIGEDYEDVYSLRLPNREVREFFRKKFIDVNFGESMFRKAMEGLKNLKFDIFQKYLQNILLKSTSFMDTKNEDFYHGLVLGMMFYLDNHYYVKSNKESGLGRYDVVIEPKNKNNRGFILEFKVVKNEDDLEKVSEEAIEQIIEKKYDVGLKDRGVKDVTFVGVAFCGKIVKVTYR